MKTKPFDMIIKSATLINEGKQFVADVLIKDDRIEKIAPSIDLENEEIVENTRHFTPFVQEII